MTEMNKMQACFREALEHEGSFIGIAVQHKEYEGVEVIINPYENIKEKMGYYQGTYDYQLNHYFSSNISIVGYGYSTNKKELLNSLLP